ncbi:MAG: DUF4340 domain-containing protein [Myxococcales bacterium]|nr:DUF4340 domain-containing protein [Myxococcales bacterium]
MNTKTLMVLGLFVALLATVLYIKYTTKPTQPASLSLPGFLEDPKVATKSSGEVKLNGLTKIVIERKGVTTVLERDGETWRMKAPKESKVEEFRIRTMMLPLQTPSESQFSKSVVESELADYGLAKDERIKVEYYRDSALLGSFIAGKKESDDDLESGPDNVDTWVLAADEQTIFLVGGKDLNSPFDVSPSDLRAKKLFDFERDQIRRVEIRNPANETHPEIVLEDKAPPPAPDAKEGEDKESARVAKWVFVKPEGFEAGTIDALAGTIAGVRVSEYLDSVEGKDTGLSANPTVVRAELFDGKTFELKLGNTEGEKTYAMLGDGDEVFALNKYTADSLKKTVNDLRQKNVLSFQGPDIQSVRFETSGFGLVRSGEEWIFDPANAYKVGKTEIEALLRDIETWTVSEFAEPLELEAKGLGPAAPATRIVFRTSRGDVRLTIGEERDGSHWAQSDTKPDEIWKVTSFMAKKFVGKTADDFRNKQIFDLVKDDIDKVEVISAAESYVIERNPASTGTDTPFLAKRGTEIVDKPKEQALNTMLNSLTNLQARTFVGDMTREEAGLTETAFRVLVTMKSGTTHELLISESTKENDNYAIATSEVDWAQQIVTINQFQAKNIMTKFKDLK